jgi:hypothetical protein
MKERLRELLAANGSSQPGQLANLLEHGRHLCQEVGLDCGW